ncbi:MAG: type II/IV secretion system ATPase subunit [Candidatus Nanoarchaeia archaeon]|nr:type II/IV secretion system ATPase subunit [Candidatus Nanoarchaeia archaeon]
MIGNSCDNFEIETEGSDKILRVNCIGCLNYPSIEDSETCMEKIIDHLISVSGISTIILSSDMNFVYPPDQTNLLDELAQCFLKLEQEHEILKYPLVNNPLLAKQIVDSMSVIKEIILNYFKKDPIGTYVKTIRAYREEKAKNENYKDDFKEISDLQLSKLETIKDELGNTTLIKSIGDRIEGYKIGDREIYREFFEPSIKPNFMFTRLMMEPPLKAKEIDSYNIGKFDKTEVVIYDVPDEVSKKYFIHPPEFELSDDDYELLTAAREVLAKHKPKKEEFTDPVRMRNIFFKISRDLIEEIAKARNIKITFANVERIARMLVRLTVGFGMIEILLEDERVEDIYVNAPIGSMPIILKHADYGELRTNIIPNVKDSFGWASRFRMMSGRPLDDANPLLDTELETPNFRARVSIVQEPLSPQGLSFVFRRHRERPFTLPLLISWKSITPLAAGVLWFLIDGGRSMMVAGTRGSGKSSILGAIMVTIMRKFRIITVEDTLELPVTYLKNLNFDIMGLKVGSALTGSSSEMDATKGIRATLRLGDSALFVGEVRSTEAVALYEAMRVGALANVVAGTIHGDSAYGVFDRVVHDLGVPVTSFKATDIIMIAQKIKTPDGLNEIRRITNIVEVRKHWEKDPFLEKGFLSLMTYDAKEDKLKPERALIEGQSEVIKSIAGNVREWAGKWDLVWDEIVTRSKACELIVKYSKENKKPEMLESDFVVVANDAYHKFFEKLKNEQGYPESKDLLFLFEEWLKNRVKKIGKGII